MMCMYKQTRLASLESKGDFILDLTQGRTLRMISRRQRKPRLMSSEISSRFTFLIPEIVGSVLGLLRSLTTTTPKCAASNGGQSSRLQIGAPPGHRR